jgi:Thiamine biosynthesis protein ThiC
MASLRKASVISGDVIGSSILKPAARKKLQRLMDSFFSDAGRQWPDLKVQQYRGDSLQALLTRNREKALRIALLLQSFLIKEKFAIRLAIGIGDISFKSKDVITSDGTAFQASGPYLDELLKSGDVISIASLDKAFTAEWMVHSEALNFIIQHWSPQQAEAIYLQLQNHTQQAIARKLKIKQPSVHQRLQGAGWPVVQKILQRFESVVPAV